MIQPNQRADGKQQTTLTFADWSATWLADLIDLRPSTIARNRSALNSHLVPTYGHIPLDQITAAMVRRENARLLSTGLAPGTITRLLRVLGACLQLAADDGLIAANPARGIRPPKTERHEQKFLTAKQVSVLANHTPEAYRGIVWLGAYGGLRIGEMMGLRCKNVNPLAGTIKVVEQVVEVSGRLCWGPPQDQRRTPNSTTTPYIMTMLLPHLAGKLPEALVFTAPEGGTLRRTLWAARVWRPACIAAGLEGLRIHDLRHTAVALWVQAGATPLELTKRAGNQLSTSHPGQPPSNTIPASR